MATSNLDGVSRGERLRHNALFRLGVMATCLMVWLVAFRGLAIPALRGLGPPGSAVGDGARVLGALIYVAGGLYIYHALVRLIERRSTTELARDPGIGLGFCGFTIGLALCSSAIGVMWLAGAAKPIGFGDSSHIVASFTAATMASVGEELLFRAILFRILEQSLGTLRALLVSALIFGLVHLVNPDATLISSLAISLEAGLLLGLAFVVTRNLWFPIGIHLAWNFAQGGIYGASGSSESPSLIEMAFFGPNWVTGGATGTDTSAVTIILCVAATVTFALMARNRGLWEPARLRFRLG